MVELMLLSYIISITAVVESIETGLATLGDSLPLAVSLGAAPASMREI